MEELLVKKAKSGDTDAFCRLMDDSMQSMYKIARSYLKNDEDVADAIQETILSCFEKLLTLKKNCYFKTWMIRILINKCNDILRNRRVFLPMDATSEKVVFEENFEMTEWNCFLEKVDEKYRIIVLLYYLEGFNTREISEILDMKESTVKSRLQRGREKVKMAYQYQQEGKMYE